MVEKRTRADHDDHEMAAADMVGKAGEDSP